jgi:hypothetical protein
VLAAALYWLARLVLVQIEGLLAAGWSAEPHSGHFPADLTGHCGCRLVANRKLLELANCRPED